MTQPPLQSRAEVQAAFPKLLVCLGIDQYNFPELMEANGQAALALAQAVGVDDPNAQVLLDHQGKVQKPLLCAALSVHASLSKFAKDVPAHLDVPIHPDEPWPEGASDLPARERLALWLVRNGADPWMKDDAGLDALDWAIQARSQPMVSLLLKHPQCPSPEELKQRTLRAGGMSTPYLHFAADVGRPGLFKVLADYGLDPDQLDNRGLPPAAWCRNEDMLRAILPYSSQEVLAEHRSAILDFWAERASKASGSAVRHEELVGVLSSLVQMDASDLEEAKMAKLAESFLAARASSYYSSDLSFNPYAATARNPTERKERISWVYKKMQEEFDWRIEKKSGVNKGRWSLMTAAMWGVFFGENSATDSRRLLAAEVESILSSKDEKELEAWLSEEIRPGLTNRGMASLTLFSDRACRSPDGKNMPFLFGSLQGPQAPGAMLGATFNAVHSLLSSQSSKRAKEEMGKVVFQYFQGMGASRLDLSPALPFIQGLVKDEVFSPSLPLYLSLSDSAIRGMKQEESLEVRKSAVQGALGLMAISSFSLKGYGSERDLDHFRLRVLDRRDKMLSALTSLLEKSPDLAQGVDPAAYPFADELPIKSGSDRINPNKDLPSPAAWASFIQGLRMNVNIPQASARPSPRPMGGGRF